MDRKRSSVKDQQTLKRIVIFIKSNSCRKSERRAQSASGFSSFNDYRDGIFRDDNEPTHASGLVPSWFDKYEDEIKHHPWPTQSSDFNMIEPLVYFRAFNTEWIFSTSISTRIFTIPS
ncbi:hypothetical protein TNCV_4288901 [Trichonephila clavipes]|nr:hypothetical protein TNCV_4288901 [Trichonephila clavipes]